MFQSLTLQIHHEPQTLLKFYASKLARPPRKIMYVNDVVVLIGAQNIEAIALCLDKTLRH